MSEMACPICASRRTVPAPALADAVLSDGRALRFPLAKASCRDCGAGFHRVQPNARVIESWYAEDYSLPSASPEADRQRSQAYAAVVAPLIGADVASVLEVGAGSGALMRELAGLCPAARFTGVEPAATDTALSPGVSLLRGTTAALDPAARFDAALSINVIEHTPDPSGFLADIAGRVRPGGEIIVICPDGEEANVELLFVDHLFTLTVASMQIAAAAAGLVVKSHAPVPPALGRFRRYAMTHGKADETDAAMSVTRHDAVIQARAAYIRAWRDLDEHLDARLGPGPLLAFGAGQMAALLRAYAPATWRRVEALLLDNPTEAWGLCKPVLAYSDASPQARILVATACRSQQAIAGRLRKDGHHAFRFDDLVSE